MTKRKRNLNDYWTPQAYIKNSSYEVKVADVMIFLDMFYDAASRHSTKKNNCKNAFFSPK